MWIVAFLTELAVIDRNLTHLRTLPELRELR